MDHVPYLDGTTTADSDSERHVDGYQQRLHFPRKTTPSNSLRYQRRKSYIALPQRFGPQIVFRDDSDDVIPKDWSSYVHPEGLRYYHNPSLGVVTDANISNDRIYGLIMLATQQVLAWLQALNFTRQDSQEVILELNENGDECNYYMIDHNVHSIFYPDETNTEDIDLSDVVSTLQLTMQLQRQYWIYLEYFPMHKELNPAVRLDLLGMLQHSIIDTLSSSNSTAVLSSSESQRYLNIIQNFTGAPESRGYETCIIARVMEDFCKGRVVHFYGEFDGARLSRREYVEEGSGPVNQKSFWFGPVSFVLFGHPNKKLQLLESLSINSIFYKESWNEFNVSHVSEWKGTTAMSLALMTIDILSITYLHESQGKHGVISSIIFQTGWHAGAVSALLCFGSLVLGLAAINVHKPHSVTTSNAGDAAVYFTNAYSNAYGYQPLAIVLGLPHALLLWGLLGTGINFIALALRNDKIWSVSILGCLVLLMSTLLLWAIRTLHSGESEQEGFFSSIFHKVFGHRDSSALEISAV
ncbi:hypothetical protein M422DRAFT_31403 [Sphaerobolus stellatus SS14]|uniref:Uncharacterized protein n=1 Tax=Sphaerobolus stellatus (strain SS14) TaxID=990650 RepID=A0A0C9UGP3_SPHS4|nr:hypothetical protein M422DRAFT_39351 [Sphaerobolus stellatus SS14]KIJ42248.1 hypothetical protein M422DRAFT_31403 [Sphaerobolus stellatus SS14]